MSNEEKVREIVDKNAMLPGILIGKYSALEMAEWKDQQFKEYLEKKLDFLKGRAMVPERNLLNEIINELFNNE